MVSIVLRLQKDKEETIADVKKSGLGLMQAVQAAKNFRVLEHEFERVKGKLRLEKKKVAARFRDKKRDFAQKLGHEYAIAVESRKGKAFVEKAATKLDRKRTFVLNVVNYAKATTDRPLLTWLGVDEVGRHWVKVERLLKANPEFQSLFRSLEDLKECWPRFEAKYPCD